MNDGPVVMRVIASTMEGIFDRPMYLASWDVNENLGFGYARLVEDVDEAHRFADFAEAMTAWKTQSTVKPLRDHDGQPNRPLTAFTVEIVSVVEAKAEDARR